MHAADRACPQQQVGCGTDDCHMKFKKFFKLLCWALTLQCTLAQQYDAHLYSSSNAMQCKASSCFCRVLTRIGASGLCCAARMSLRVNLATRRCPAGGTMMLDTLERAEMTWL
jgi:hypothetical protein